MHMLSVAGKAIVLVNLDWAKFWTLLGLEQLVD